MGSDVAKVNGAYEVRVKAGLGGEGGSETFQYIVKNTFPEEDLNRDIYSQRALEVGKRLAKEFGKTLEMKLTFFDS